MSTLWIAAVAPFFLFLTAMITLWVARRQDRANVDKTTADTLKVVQDATLSLLKPYQEQVEKLQAGQALLVKENEELKRRQSKVEARLEIAEDDRDTLATAVRAHVDWEDQGRADPPGAPRIGPRVRRILERLHGPAIT